MKIIVTVFVVLFSGLTFATPLNKIVVFGDSLSDNGNFYEYMKHQMPISPPYYEGRFTNGPVWIERLAQTYFPNDPKAHLLDYAFGGAGVAGEEADNDDDDTLFTLRSEVDSYLLAHQDKADENSLYVLWMGANNYLALADDVEQTITDVNWGIKNSLQRLVHKGAKHFLVVNLPDLGRTPTAREFDAVEQLKYSSLQNNAMLSQNIAKLKQDYPEVQWLYFDVYEALNELIDNPTPYGFTNTTDTCYEAVIDKPSAKTMVNLVAKIRSPLGKDACEGYLFFDPVHPSALAHQIMADRLVELFRAHNVLFG